MYVETKLLTTWFYIIYCVVGKCYCFYCFLIFNPFSYFFVTFCFSFLKITFVQTAVEEGTEESGNLNCCLGAT